MRIDSMTLFEASFLDEPVAVAPPARKKPKKEKILQEPTPSIDESPDTQVPEVPKEKKVKAKKAIAKPVEKVEEPVKPKRVRKPKATTPLPAEEEEQVTPEPVKKAPRKRKAIEVITEPPIVPKKKRAPPKPKAPKMIIDGDKVDEPPSWFKSYLLDEANRRNNEAVKTEKKPKTEIKAAATQQAQEKWSDGFTRDRVMNEVGRHQNKLYSQIFSKKL